MGFRTRAAWLHIAAMRFQRKAERVRVFCVLIDKTRISTPSADVREIAWRYALQRLERFGAGSRDNLHVLPDEGHGDFIRKKIRLMRRFNHVPSAFGGRALGLFPAAAFGGEVWDDLGAARVLEVNSIRGGPPDIVVWPT